MVNKRLLEKELKEYFDVGINMKSVKINKNTFKDIFDKYNNYGMSECDYCCYGIETNCWVEIIEEGNWGLTLERVKKNILRVIRDSKKYLYNGRKYGSSRLYIGYKDDICYVYIYLRDKLQKDYHIWFDNKSEV